MKETTRHPLFIFAALLLTPLAALRAAG